MDKSKISNISNINKRKVRINPGMLAFLFLFIYLAIYLIFYMSKKQLTLYQVTKSDISQDNIYSGLIIRDETVFKTEQAGYVAYYVSNGTRVKVDQPVFSIDENGSMIDSLTNENTVLNDSDYYKINNVVTDFNTGFDTVNFNNVYSFEEDLNNKIFELTSDARYNNISDKNSNDKMVNVNKSTTSGTVSYYIDGLENIKEDDKLSTYFDDYEYSYKKLSTGTLVETGAPVYKILNSNKWNIIIKISEQDYNTYKDLSVISCFLNNSHKKTRANIEVFSQEDNYYAKLTLYKYAINYFDSRFVNVELELDNASGLKIPNSAIVEQDFYVVPKSCFMMSGNNKSVGVSAYLKNEDGVQEYSFVNTEIYYEKDKSFYYISADLFDEGTLLMDNEDSSKTFTLSEKDTLKGVYNANNGYNLFRRIEVLYSNKDYSIINANTDYGVNAYDNIILDASKTSENMIIY